MEINIKNILSSNYNSEFLPVFPILSNDKLIFGVNTNGLNNSIYGKECYIVCYNIKKNITEWHLKFKDEFAIGIETKLRIFNDKLIACTTRELLAISITEGSVIWKKILKNASCQITIIENRLFFANWGELMELDIENGKKLQSRKPRVNWFDSEIVTHKNRYFISTSNSKIIEISLSPINVINQYKFPGGWAIGEEPFFYNDIMVSGSYGSKIVLFDLISNSDIKKFQKKAGSKPMQVIDKEKLFIYEDINSVASSLTCYNLEKTKKIWSLKNQKIIKLNIIENTLFVIIKINSHFCICKLNKENGKVEETIEKKEFANWEKFNYLKGIDIIFKNNQLILSYEPNYIRIKTVHNNV